MGEGEEVVQASISLFSAGIGDLGIEYGCSIPVAISAELVPDARFDSNKLSGLQRCRG